MDRRSEQGLRARRKLLKRDLGDAFGSLYTLLDDAVGQESTETSLARIRPSIESAWTQFESTLAKARESYNPAHLHSLRVVTKRLRYRLELAHSVGNDQMKPFVGWSKGLQEVLGKWHDRQVLRQMVAQALASPDLLLRDPVTVRVLLTELEKDLTRQQKTADEILTVAVEHPAYRRVVSAARASA
jgi:CHAD domain-containing protein